MAESTLTEVLTVHERVVGIRDLRQHCTCGWVSGERQGVAAHREHLASVLAASAQAAADERAERIVTALMRAEEDTGLVENDGTALGAYSQALRDAQDIARSTR